MTSLLIFKFSVFLTGSRFSFCLFLATLLISIYLFIVYFSYSISKLCSSLGISHILQILSWRVPPFYFKYNDNSKIQVPQFVTSLSFRSTYNIHIYNSASHLSYLHISEAPKTEHASMCTPVPLPSSQTLRVFYFSLPISVGGLPSV